MIYAKNGSPEFNERMRAFLQELAERVHEKAGDNLIALVLGGGYGRGEGGVTRINGIEQPYNDLDLVPVVRNKCLAWSTGLPRAENERQMNPDLHVDFCRPQTIRDIERWPNRMVWHDLYQGHVILRGPSDVITAHAPRILQEPLPALEASRLLLNRGAGLVWAMRVIRGFEPAPDGDFIRRNYYKCALALGDALLILYRRYTVQYEGRDKNMAELSVRERIVGDMRLNDLYERALQFKFFPDQLPTQIPTEQELRELAGQWGAVFLHLENKRLGRDWGSLEDYLGWGGVREAEEHQPSRVFRHIAQNLRLGRLSWRHPRENFYMKVPLLLGLTKRFIRPWARESEEFIFSWSKFN